MATTSYYFEPENGGMPAVAREPKKSSVISPQPTNNITKNPTRTPTPQRVSNSNNASFTSSSFHTRKEPGLSRFATLNRSFNNAANMAKKKLNEIGNEGALTATNGTKESQGRSVEDFMNAAASAQTNSASDIMRKLSQRVKVTLSDPLKAANVSSCPSENAGVSPLSKTNSIKKRVALISNRLQLPNFLTDESDQQKEGKELLNDDDERASSSDESDDAELLDLQEREQIVEKYEKGPDSAEVDPWENPDFELYKITDRFGFVHKDEPVPSAEEEEKRRVAREVKREGKWCKMLEEWKKQHHPIKLPERIWKGIPETLRYEFWRRLLGVEEMKSNARENLYMELLMLISKDVKQIDLDINRTYRDHLAFRRRYDLKQQSLFNVLSAYAMFNTEVGYCQGMSGIAAILLMYMDEEDAFWCLHSLMVNRKYTMHGFFVPGFPKLHRFQNHYEKVILKYLPKVKKHFDKAQIPPIYLTKWWFGCFLDRVPFSLAIRVWDVFLYYGDSVLIAMSYNIIRMHRRTILKLQMEGFMEFLQHRLATNFGYTNDKTMESLEECLKKLQSDKMALPLPPNPGEQAEVPTKPLAPILTRSMMDIRMDIAEIHSRSSRANSLAGRSPAMKRYQSNQRKPPSPMPIPCQTQSSTSIATAVDPSQTPLANSPTLHHRDFPGSQPNPMSRQEEVKNQAAPSRTSSTKLGKNGRPMPPPAVPDADGFIPWNPQMGRQPQKRAQRDSFYDNVTSPPNVSSSREGSVKTNVRRTPNNVTYVAVEDLESESRVMANDSIVYNNSSKRTINPDLYCPPPDYDDDEEEEEREKREWKRSSLQRKTEQQGFAPQRPTTNNSQIRRF